jgi:two-component system, response regulator FlrC
LRDRQDDVLFLAEEFMKRFTRKHGIRVGGFSDKAVRVLKAHHWPGNVRELQNVIERAVILCGDSEMLEPDHLGLAISVPDSAPAPAAVSTSTAAPVNGSEEFIDMAEMEKRHILNALDRCNGNRTHAAKMLKISIRTLRNKLNEYGYGKGQDEEESVSEE